MKVQGCLALLKQQAHHDWFVLRYLIFHQVCLINPSVGSSARPTETEECMGGSPTLQFSTLLLAQADLDPGQHTKCKVLRNIARPSL